MERLIWNVTQGSLLWQHCAARFRHGGMGYTSCVYVIFETFMDFGKLVFFFVMFLLSTKRLATIMKTSTLGRHDGPGIMTSDAIYNPGGPLVLADSS